MPRVYNSEYIPEFDFIRPNWMQFAACLGETTEKFFPARADNDFVVRIAELCNECCVKDECLKYAEDTKTRDGIWGGVRFVNGRKERIVLVQQGGRLVKRFERVKKEKEPIEG